MECFYGTLKVNAKLARLVRNESKCWVPSFVVRDAKFRPFFQNRIFQPTLSVQHSAPNTALHCSTVSIKAKV